MPSSLSHHSGSAPRTLIWSVLLVVPVAVLLAELNIGSFATFALALVAYTALLARSRVLSVRRVAAAAAELESAVEQLADERAQVEEFHRFIELVAGESDPDRLADIVLTELCEHLGAAVGTLYGVDGDHGSAMTRLSALGVDSSRLPAEILPGEGFAGRAIVERKVLTAGFGDEGLRFESFGHEVRLAQEIHIPLVHGEQAVGVVTLGRTSGHGLGTGELDRVRYLATHAAVGLAHAFALRRARDQAALNRAVLDSAYDAFVAFDERGRVTAWNPRAEAIFGWSAIEAVGREVSELIVPPRDRESHRQSLARFLRGEWSELLNRRIELTGRHRDGHELPVEVALSPIELNGSRQFNAFIHDISERRMLEERSVRLFSISLDFMCTFSPDGYLRQINPAWGEVLGWSDEELLGSNMIEYVHPDDRERTLEQAHKLEREGEAAADFENRWRCADGTYRWLLWSAHVSRAEGLIYAVAKDVTELKRAERFFRVRYAVTKALADSETLEQDVTGVLAAAGESLGFELGAAWLPESEGRRMRSASTWAAPGVEAPALETLELASGQGLVGQAWESGQPRWMSDIRHDDGAREAGVRATVAVPLVGADSVVAVLQLFATHVREPDEDALDLLTAIGEQVGPAVERRLARMEADRMKDEFLALVSHELRTPLTSIVGYVELLGDDSLELDSDQARHFLEATERNAIRLQRLVDDVLFAARAEAGRLALAGGEVDLTALASESVAARQPKAEERGVELHLDAGPTPPIVGDRERLGQALDQLVSNALKFTPPGGRVEVWVRNAGERAVIAVRDTGLGMSEGDRAQVFDRFFRAAATRDHAPGVGLGLTIVKTIVEGHGGSIEVASTEGAGTTFRIELPLERAAEQVN